MAAVAQEEEEQDSIIVLSLPAVARGGGSNIGANAD